MSYHSPLDGTGYLKISLQMNSFAEEDAKDTINGITGNLIETYRKWKAMETYMKLKKKTVEISQTDTEERRLGEIETHRRNQKQKRQEQTVNHLAKSYKG